FLFLFFIRYRRVMARDTRCGRVEGRGSWREEGPNDGRWPLPLSRFATPNASRPRRCLCCWPCFLLPRHCCCYTDLCLASPASICLYPPPNRPSASGLTRPPRMLLPWLRLPRTCTWTR